MSARPDHFELLQDRLVARLANYKDDPADAKPFLQTTANGKTIDVFDERLGDLAGKLQKALTSLNGIGIIVLTPLAQLRDPKVGNLDMRGLVKVQVQENVQFNQGNNGTKVSAMAVRNMIMRAIQHWPHQLYNGPDDTQRVLLQPVPFILVTPDPILTYDVDATASINLRAPLRA